MLGFRACLMGRKRITNGRGGRDSEFIFWPRRREARIPTSTNPGGTSAHLKRAAQCHSHFGRIYERRYEGGIYYWRESWVGVGDGADFEQARDCGDFGFARFEEGAGSGGEIARRKR